ncbi:MAG: DUF4377 domain-containing protein [Chitinophagales bacterium]|jgi:hypothetical protein|nr:DUF4377 domain-containing protein [Chitinophagales bacterium]
MKNYILFLVMFIGCLISSCNPKVIPNQKLPNQVSNIPTKVDEPTSKSYIVKIYPQFRFINDPMMPNKRPCIEGEVNGQKTMYCQGINGFIYEEGFEYEIEILEENLDPIPADYLDNKIYKLKKIISKTAVKQLIGSTSTIPNPKLERIHISTQFNQAETNAAGYHYIFALTNDGGGFGSRAATFERIEAWQNDTRERLKSAKHIKGGEYIIKTLSAELLNQIDFSKENLIIVYASTGGPPFGGLQNELKNQTYEFYVNHSRSPLMGLKTYFECYKTPKPYRAVLK